MTVRVHSAHREAYVNKRLPHFVELPRKRENGGADAWCKEQFGPPALTMVPENGPNQTWYDFHDGRRWHRRYNCFWFLDAKDAVYFKLRWC